MLIARLGDGPRGYHRIILFTSFTAPPPFYDRVIVFTD